MAAKKKKAARTRAPPRLSSADQEMEAAAFRRQYIRDHSKEFHHHSKGKGGEVAVLSTLGVLGALGAIRYRNALFGPAGAMVQLHERAEQLAGQAMEHVKQKYTDFQQWRNVGPMQGIETEIAAQNLAHQEGLKAPPPEEPQQELPLPLPELAPAVSRSQNRPVLRRRLKNIRSFRPKVKARRPKPGRPFVTAYDKLDMDVLNQLGLAVLPITKNIKLPRPATTATTTNI